MTVLSVREDIDFSFLFCGYVVGHEDRLWYPVVSGTVSDYFDGSF
jgi:hypothetical protein